MAAAETRRGDETDAGKRIYPGGAFDPLNFAKVGVGTAVVLCCAVLGLTVVRVEAVRPTHHACTPGRNQRTLVLSLCNTHTRNAFKTTGRH
jgi:hypothetical protein